MCRRRSEKPPGYSLPAAISCCVTRGRDRADRALVAVRVAGVVQEHARRAARSRRGSSPPASASSELLGVIGNGESCDDERMVAEHDASAGRGPWRARRGTRRADRARARRRRCRCPACRRCRCPRTRRPWRSRREVGRLVAREELVVEAVVALPLADAARRVRGRRRGRDRGCRG